VERAKLIDEDVPESLVSSEMQARLQNLAYQLQGRGIGLDDYLQVMGRDAEGFTAELKEAAEEAVRVDLALRAVAAAEGLEATDEDLDEEIALLIAEADIDLDEAKEQLRTGGQLSAVRSDVSKRNALEWLVDHSEVVDPDGAPIAEELLKLPDEPEHDHDGHDHGHDHAHEGHDHDHAH
jgi:trigger factor